MPKTYKDLEKEFDNFICNRLSFLANEKEQIIKLKSFLRHAIQTFREETRVEEKEHKMGDNDLKQISKRGFNNALTEKYKREEEFMN